MEDGFTRAEAYIQAKANKNELVRTDLELEALAENPVKKIHYLPQLCAERDQHADASGRAPRIVNTFPHFGRLQGS